MKKIFLLTIALVITHFAFSQNPQSNIDPYVKTFISDTKFVPDYLKQNELKQQPAWQNFISVHGKWNVQFDEINGKPFRAFGKGIATEGATIEERAENFIQNDLQLFAPESADLVLQSIRTSKYHYINFKQQYLGLDVLFSNATLRMTKPENKIILFGLQTFSDIDVNITPAIDPAQAESFAAADFTITVNAMEAEPQLAILPVPAADKSAYSYHLVYTVHVHTTDNENLPGNYYTLVDANSGEVLYRQNDVKVCGSYLMDANVEMQAEITDNPLQPTVLRGLPYIRVTIDGVHYYADENGILNLPFITEATEATVKLRGSYGQVYDGETGADMAEFVTTLLPGDNYIAFDTESGANAREVSAYYHQAIVHDHATSLYPDFTTLDYPQYVYVDRHDGACNAYYDGNINFFAEGSGCLASALFDDVVYHEYGHGINENLYAFLGDFSGMNNGAMNEGYADIWAYTITEYPILAQGWTGTPESNIRRYDLGPKYYPDDITGEVHNDGEIIAGAWWDVYENFDYDMDAMIAVWKESQYGTPDGPAGTEGNVYTSVLIEALLADDDNDDPSDGTPNMLLIMDAFAEHGIFILGDVRIEHIESTVSLSPAETVIMYANLITDFPLYAGSFKLFHRTSPSADFTSTNMYVLSESSYFANLGTYPPGTVIEYYFQVEDVFGNHAADAPLKVGGDDPNLSYFAIIGYDNIATEDFDNTMGAWVVDPFGDDDATNGAWVVAIPIQTFDILSYIVQPGYDHTAGSSNVCVVTGNASGPPSVGDIDEGKTTLLSPAFDITGMDNPLFTYYRWFSNDAPTSANKGNDPWQVFISNNGTDWVKVERTFTSDNNWRKNVIQILEYVEPSATVSLLFVAQDSLMPGEFADGQGTVDAALDDLQLWAADMSLAIHSPTSDNINMMLFPNPANDKLMITLADFSGEMELHIYNTLGELVLVNNKNVIAGSQSVCDITALIPGIYTMRVFTSAGNVSAQFVKQNP